MKAFRFRLDQALRWRATQRDLAKSQVAAAAKLLRELREEIDARRNSLTTGAQAFSTNGATGESLSSWASFTEHTVRRIRDLELHVRKAEQALAAQMQLLAEANRKVQLLENLRHRQLDHWNADFNRELEAFAAETFLFRLQSRGVWARSSAG
jgi:flagellar export protein FliJ